MPNANADEILRASKAAAAGYLQAAEAVRNIVLSLRRWREAEEARQRGNAR